MGLTAEQFDKLNLTADEFDRLGLTAFAFDQMTYEQFLELVEIRLQREPPKEAEEMEKDSLSIRNTLDVLAQKNKEILANLDRSEARHEERDRLDAKERCKDRVMDFVYCFLGAVLGGLAGYIIDRILG